jgi:DNA-binding NarL/FixJ family response regulator
VTVRILVADDHPLVRNGLRRVLETEPGFEVVAEATDGAEAVVKAVAEGVDLAILDLAMPRLTGLQAATQLARRSPTTRVLILSMYGTEQHVLAAARAGARGYVVKSMADEELVAACRAVVDGQPFVWPTGISQTLRDRADAGGALPESILTPREREVVKLVAEGHTSEEIARLLVLSVKTVERHRSNISQKLDVRGNAGMIRYAIRAGLVEP